MPAPGRRSQVVRQRSAKSLSPVRLRPPPPTSLLQTGTFLWCATVHTTSESARLPTFCRRDAAALPDTIEHVASPELLAPRGGGSVLPHRVRAARGVRAVRDGS